MKCSYFVGRRTALFCSDVKARTISVRTPLTRCLATVEAEPKATTCCRLTSTRGVLRLGGPELISFLQGRHLHDMFLHKVVDSTKGNEPVILADVDKRTLPDLKKKLTMYKLRAAVDIADVSDEYTVWVEFGNGLPLNGEWKADPRLGSLGYRTVLQEGQALIPSTSPNCESSEREFKRWRLHQGVAEGDIEMPHGHAMPLEYNLDALNGVSYTKGCYVGQELIARTHNKGVVRKRLVPVVLQGPDPELDATVSLATGGSDAGKVRAVESGVALAHLRLKPALSAMDSNLELKCGDTLLKPWRPAWWPSSWGHEE